jgi:hypothetical protein
MFSEDASVTTRKQHVVSKVLLRHWGEPFVAVDLRYRTSRRQYAAAEGYIPYFVRADYSEEVESVWKETEDLLPEALGKVEIRTIFEEPASLDTLRSAVALHLVRSKRSAAVAASWHRAQSDTAGGLSELVAIADRPRDMAMLYAHRTGLVAATAFQIEQEGQHLRADVDGIFGAGGEMFVERVLLLYERALEFIRGRSLQIGIAGDGEFVICDSPAVTYDHTSGKVCIPFEDASTIVMPVGPEFVVVVGGEAGFVDLDGKAVTWLNRLQVSAAFEKVYMRKGSGLEQWVLNMTESRRGTSL